MLVANLITLARLPLLLALLAILLGAPAWQYQFLGLGLLVVLFLMDCWDGYVARRRQEVTQLGAVLDVALDRAVENILWIAFLHIGLVSFWVPVVFLIRSFVVDGIREVAAGQGKLGFSMMHSPWGRFLVASRTMRATYGLAKWVTFTSLWLTNALRTPLPDFPGAWQPVNSVLIWLTVGLCVIRGIPVVFDGRLYFRNGARPGAAQEASSREKRDP
jgi:CDP-diacylglycerol--glycerol-3-phosphate 3-phosphatidyltransferase